MNKEKLRPLKGFRDFLPKEALKRKYVQDKIEKVFQKWGFTPLETPTLESLDLFLGQIGEDEKLFYSFKDQGGRSVILRYDQTVPACRVVAQNFQDLPMPFKRYQIQPAFRAEKPQKGRYREFLQCDADIFGAENPEADAEVTALSLDIYKSLGFKKATALINDRDLIKNIPYNALISIDKIKKIGEDNVLKEMQKKGFSKKGACDYLKYVKNLKPSKAVEIIFEYLKNYGFTKDWYKFDPTIVRSFAYSTGPIWEIEIPNFEGGSVLGGERYDRLVKDISGKEIPGTGFGLGFDRTLEAMEQFKLLPETLTLSKVLVTIFNKDLLKNSIEIAKYFRDKGINTEIYSNPETKLDKQIKYAAKEGIPNVAIVGPNEVEKGMITVKNLKTGEQKSMTYTEFTRA